MTEYSYNGWVASRSPGSIGVVPLVVAGHSFPAGVRGGDVHVVHEYFWTQFHHRVQPLRSPGCWGYNFRLNRNANNLSCHGSGTASDGNAPQHPNGIEASRNFTPAQIAEIHKILAEVDHVLHWGGDWHHPLTPDPMHVEIHGTAAQVHAVAEKIRARTTHQEDTMADPATTKLLQQIARDVGITKSLAIATAKDVAELQQDFDDEHNIAKARHSRTKGLLEQLADDGDEDAVAHAGAGQ